MLIVKHCVYVFPTESWTSGDILHFPKITKQDRRLMRQDRRRAEAACQNLRPVV